MAFGSFAVSCLFFVLAIVAAIGDLPYVELACSGLSNASCSLKTDIICLRVLTLVWVGYPIVTIAARIGHIGVPGDKYSATWSFIKDLSFAFLDIVSKGGLAAVVVLKAFWITAQEEAAIIQAGKFAIEST